MNLRVFIRRSGVEVSWTCGSDEEAGSRATFRPGEVALVGRAWDLQPPDPVLAPARLRSRDDALRLGPRDRLRRPVHRDLGRLWQARGALHAAGGNADTGRAGG